MINLQSRQYGFSEEYIEWISVFPDVFNYMVIFGMLRGIAHEFKNIAFGFEFYASLNYGCTFHIDETGFFCQLLPFGRIEYRAVEGCDC